MSAVLTKTKQHYQQALTLELILFSVLTAVLCVWQLRAGLAFGLGALCALLPFGLVVYWVFFRKKNTPSTSLRAFYSGEALKWLLTIVLIILVLKLYPAVQILSFFVGYLFALIANSFVPFVLFQRAKSAKKSS